MNELISKLTTYNLFNNLFPGFLLVYILRAMGYLTELKGDPITLFFVYYFIGIVVSRFGSLIVEPMLKKVSFLKFEDYSGFIKASQLDAKIEVMNETNNMYRTVVSMLTLVLTYTLAIHISTYVPWLGTLNFVMIILLALFLFSYRKQTDYISKRVKFINSNKF